MKISAYIITLNEEQNIKDCIKSLDFCDEIVIIDSHSNDNTCKIAKSLKARVIQNEFLGYGAQKQFGAKACKHKWVLNLDADERISKELKQSIIEIKNNKNIDKNTKAYKMCRANFIGNKRIKHSGWYKDIKIRLFDRDCFKWDNALVHEKISPVNKKYKCEFINKDIIHYAYKDINHYKQTMSKYSNLAAKMLLKHITQNNKATFWGRVSLFLQTNVLLFVKMALKPIVKFIEVYIYKLGVFDGYYGFVIAKTSAVNMFLKFYQLNQMLIEQNCEQTIDNIKANRNQMKINTPLQNKSDAQK